jgi:hypothetical protein
MPPGAPEPLVIVERPAEASLRRWTALQGRKPALLLIDRGNPEGAGLDLPLAAEGFDVYRTTGHRSALDLLHAHPSVLMALVRTRLPNLEAPALIRDLRQARPGLWIGLLCDPAERTAARAAYAAGAVDLFLSTAAPPETAERLLRSIPWAVRLRDRADRRGRRRWASGLRHLARRAASGLGTALTIGGFLLVGGAMALLTRSWQESRDREDARIERVLNALEARSPVDRGERLFDRWQRQEQLDLERRSQDLLGAQYQSQREEERLRELMRVAVPHYPR